MQPTIDNGALLLARRTNPKFGFAPGQIVLFNNPLRPHLVEIKRLVNQSDGGWWVEGDNPEFSTDSREYGPIDPATIKGIVIRNF